jgi:hypothetical protein
MEYRHKISTIGPSSNIEMVINGNDDQYQNFARILSRKHKDQNLEHIVVATKAGSFASATTYWNGDVIETDIPKPFSKEAFEMYFELFPDESANYTLVDGEYKLYLPDLEQLIKEEAA